jgi:hypothetical protein
MLVHDTPGRYFYLFHGRDMEKQVPKSITVTVSGGRA